VTIFEEAADEAEILAKQCYPIFAGQPAMVQGAALAELVARHLSGHVILGNAEKTKALRAGLLEAFVKTVNDLVPIIDEDVIQPQIKARAQ
jgi:hypothetical protein